MITSGYTRLSEFMRSDCCDSPLFSAYDLLHDWHSVHCGVCYQIHAYVKGFDLHMTEGGEFPPDDGAVNPAGQVLTHLSTQEFVESWRRVVLQAQRALEAFGRSLDAQQIPQSDED